MQKIPSLLTLIIIALIVQTPALAHWVENYYDCLCYSGNKIECMRKIESDYPEFRDYASNPTSPQESNLFLTQVRAAEIILDQRYMSRPEESACLNMAKTHIQHALFFSLKEKSEWHPTSPTYIKALYELSREIYQWAEENCFNQAGPPSHTLNISLPNPNLCKRFH